MPIENLASTSLWAFAATAVVLATLTLLWPFAMLGRLWQRRRAPLAAELMNPPGAAVAAWGTRLRRRRAVLRVSLGAALLAVSASPWLPIIIAPGAWPAVLAICTLLLTTAAAVTTDVVLTRRIRRSERDLTARRLVADNLARISAEHQRVFHDVDVGGAAPRRIDHILVNVHGAFAVTTIAEPVRGNGVAHVDGDWLCLGVDRRIDLRPILAAVKRLQHQLSKPLGKVIRLRAVVALPGWRCQTPASQSLLVSGHRELVMLQGWRAAADGLLTEDARALHDMLAARSRLCDTRPAAPASLVERPRHGRDPARFAEAQ